MKRAIITGATGFIGLALIRKLIDENVEVIALARKESDRVKYIPKHDLVNVIYCNMDDILKLKDSNLPDCDVFFSLAWKSTSSYLSRNDIRTNFSSIQYTLDAVELAAYLNCKTFIGVGSQSEYGILHSKITEHLIPKPTGAYGLSKFTAGELSRELCSTYGIKHNWARVLSVYGPYDRPTTLIMYTTKSLLNNIEPELSKCEQIWDYIYVDDCADALFLIAEHGKHGKTYTVASGKERKLFEYINEIKEIVGADINIKFGAKDYQPNQSMVLAADITPLQKDTGFAPNVSFKEGIKNIIDWIGNNKGE